MIFPDCHFSPSDWPEPLRLSIHESIHKSIHLLEKFLYIIDYMRFFNPRTIHKSIHQTSKMAKVEHVVIGVIQEEVSRILT